MFNTLRTGMPGQPSFTTCVSYLVEDIGFIYAGLIQSNVASFIVNWESGADKGSTVIAAVCPSWEQYYPPGQDAEDFDLGNGKVKLRYTFGAMKESGYKKYYRRNMSSSGLEVRLNGRVLSHNIFKDVWHRERHNMWNHFLVTVDIISEKSDRLPSTRTSKNGLRQGDPRLDALYEWVLRRCPTPPRVIGEAASERDLFEELSNQKKFHIPDPKTVTTEQFVFQTLNEKVRVDLYVAHGDRVWLYEGKKDETTVKDVYQLKLYWDGAALDKLNPTNGVLLATCHPESVVNMVNYINTMVDIRGRKYNFVAKTWKEEGIQYPT